MAKSVVMFRLIFENGDFGCFVEKALWSIR